MLGMAHPRAAGALGCTSHDAWSPRLLKQALRRRVRVRGPEHPKTPTTKTPRHVILCIQYLVRVVDSYVVRFAVGRRPSWVGLTLLEPLQP